MGVAGPPTPRLLAVGRVAATRAGDDARSNKDTNVEANWRALKVGAGGQARKPAGPREEETVGVQGHRGGAPYGVEEAIWARGGGRLAAGDRTTAVAAIKGGREAKTLEEEADDAGVNDNEVANGGGHDRRRRGLS